MSTTLTYDLDAAIRGAQERFGQSDAILNTVLKHTVSALYTSKTTIIGRDSARAAYDALVFVLLDWPYPVFPIRGAPTARLVETLLMSVFTETAKVMS